MKKVINEEGSRPIKVWTNDIEDEALKYDYVSDGERCENCRHFKDGYTKLINSIPRAERPYCKLGEFYTNKHGICNEWGGEIRKAQEK